MLPVIVVLAFSRPLALRRLLQSLSEADYPEGVSLIISVDGGANSDVVDIANNFSSNKITTRVIERKVQLGLREHVLACGDLSLEFGSIIVLEDDLVVDRYFYSYASKALEYYRIAKSVSGVALYGPECSEASRLPFRPMLNGYSSYFMKVPCSWGQCWTSSQWKSFRSWYVQKTAEDLRKIEGLPEYVKSWPESSWKKYFYGYMVESNKDFIYPYDSYSTNCSDEGGVHVVDGSNLWQVKMASDRRPHPTFKFCPEGVREVAYDPFFEPVGEYAYRSLGMSEGDLVFDLQGMKPLSLIRKKKYVLTPKCKRDAYDGVKSRKEIFSHEFRPPEKNFNFPKSRYEEGCWFLIPTYACCEKNSLVWNQSSIDAYAGMAVFRKGIFFLSVKWTLSSLIKKIVRFIWVGR